MPNSAVKKRLVLGLMVLTMFVAAVQIVFAWAIFTTNQQACLSPTAEAEPRLQPAFISNEQ